MDKGVLRKFGRRKLNHLIAYINTKSTAGLHGRQDLSSPAADLENPLAWGDYPGNKILDRDVIISVLLLPVIIIRRDRIEMLLNILFFHNWRHRLNTPGQAQRELHGDVGIKPRPEI